MSNYGLNAITPTFTAFRLNTIYLTVIHFTNSAHILSYIKYCNNIIVCKYNISQL